MKEKKIDFTKKIFMLCILIIISITWFFLLLRINIVTTRILDMIKSVRAVIYGIILAYLFNPIMMSSRRFILHLLENKQCGLNKKRCAKIISITITVVIGIVILTLICFVILPSTYNTLADLLPKLPSLVDQYLITLSEKIASSKKLNSTFYQVLEKSMLYFEDWFSNSLISKSNSILSYVTKSIMNVTRITFDLVVGIIVAIYAFMEKEKFIAQSKKIIYALFNIKSANYIIDTARYAHKTFSGFLIGKIIDSLIVGIISYPILLVMHIPYALLLSVIIGITNIIPYFGPLIGAVPCTILVFLVDGKKSVYFILFIIILQQIDGNIIGPKILKNTTHVSEFWVTFALLLAGGIWGFIGMIIGVPLFAVLYSIVKHIIEKLLLQKNLPADSCSYINAKNIDEENHILVYNDSVH
ncbi:MAG: AI-2E family transporter [Clostridiales bacterium]|nr:AI-2E family transporter [Clostridiales bacterium]